MSSKLVSLARVVFASKAAAARTAPAAVVGPLQRIFGGADNTGEERHEEDQQQQQQEEETEDPAVNSEETPAPSVGVFASLLSRAEASITTTTRAASTAPIDSPSARRELRDFQRDYYRRSMAVAVVDAVAESSPPIADPDLSIPVGDEYLYLAQ